MTNEMRETLKQMAAPVLPSRKQMRKLYEGWDAYFRRMGIEAARESEEFDGIMRARVEAGIIRLGAPKVEVTSD